MAARAGLALVHQPEAGITWRYDALPALGGGSVRAPGGGQPGKGAGREGSTSQAPVELAVPAHQAPQPSGEGEDELDGFISLEPGERKARGARQGARRGGASADGLCAAAARSLCEQLTHARTSPAACLAGKG